MYLELRAVWLLWYLPMGITHWNDVHNPREHFETVGMRYDNHHYLVMSMLCHAHWSRKFMERVSVQCNSFEWKCSAMSNNLKKLATMKYHDRLSTYFKKGVHRSLWLAHQENHSPIDRWARMAANDNDQVRSKWHWEAIEGVAIYTVISLI